MEMKFVLRSVSLRVRLALFAAMALAGVVLQVLIPIRYGFAVGTGLVFVAAGLVWAASLGGFVRDIGEWRPVARERLEEALAQAVQGKDPGLSVLSSHRGWTALVAVVSAGLWRVVDDSLAVTFFFDFTELLSLAPREEDTLIVQPRARLGRDEAGRAVVTDVRMVITPLNRPDDFVNTQLVVTMNNGPKGPVPYLYAVFLCREQSAIYRRLVQDDYYPWLTESKCDGGYGAIVVRYDDTRRRRMIEVRSTASSTGSSARWRVGSRAHAGSALASGSASVPATSSKRPRVAHAAPNASRSCLLQDSLRLGLWTLYQPRTGLVGSLST